jgi:hypothetical protein
LPPQKKIGNSLSVRAVIPEENQEQEFPGCGGCVWECVVPLPLNFLGQEFNGWGMTEGYFKIFETGILICGMIG